MVKIGILKENYKAEKRVAMIPQFIKKLIELGYEVFVEKSAGEDSFYHDSEYAENGAKIVEKDLVYNCDVILKVSAFEKEEIEKINGEKILITNMSLFSNLETVKIINSKKLTLLSLDLLPRISRAQTMDVLSSQSNIAGYAAVMKACFIYPKVFPMMITAAGSIAPAKVFVMGVGVAGLSAISTAKRLGAIVSAYDVRSQTKEQVLSLGAKFLDINYKVQDENLVYAKEMDSEYKKFEEEAIINHIKSQDVIISSAMIMGKKAPILINEKVFDNIKSGAVIIDMASETGGNCIYTKDGVLEEKNGVFIWGGSKLANDFPKDSSFMYSKNILNFITYLTKESKINLEDMNDEILNSVIVCKDGNFVSKILKGVLI